jgi:hypothetical protein
VKPSTCCVWVCLLALSSIPAASDTLPVESSAGASAGPEAAEADSAAAAADRVISPNVGAASNVAYVGRALFGSVFAARWFTVAATTYVAAGHGPTLTIYKYTAPSTLATVSRMDFEDTIFGIEIVGTTAYVGAYTTGLQIVNLATPAAPVLLGGYVTSFNATRLAVSGAYAYMFGGSSGIQTLNVSSPGAITSVSIVAAGSGSVAGVVSGGYLYVGDGFNGLKIYSLAAPGTPALTGTLGGIGYARGLAVAGGYAYVGADTSGLRVVNVSTPSAPTLAGTWDSPGTAFDVALVGTTAYVSDQTSGLAVVDVTTPAAPIWRGTAAVPAWAWTAAATGTTVFVAGREGGLSLVNAAAPTAPVVAATVDAGFSVDRIVSTTTRAFVGDANVGLSVLDVSNPGSPVTLAFLPAEKVTALALADDLLYTASAGTVRTWSVANAASPLLVATTPTVASPAAAAVEGARVVIGSSSATIEVFSRSNTGALTSLGTVSVPGAFFRDVALRNGIAFASYGSPYGVAIVDVSGAAPILLGQISTTQAAGLAVNGQTLYLADGTSLRLYDVSIPSSPLLLSTTTMTANDVAVSGSTAYVAGGLSGASVMDATNPAALTQLGYYDTAGVASQIAVAGGNVLVGHQTGALWILRQTTGCIDAWESNDSVSAAVPMPSATGISPKLCSPSDLDWYRFDVASHGVVAVTMKPPAGYDYDVFLYDPSGNLAAASVNPTGLTESISHVATTTGAWKILVAPFNTASTSATYLLSAASTPCPTIAQAVYVPGVTLDSNSHPVLRIQDPNEPGTSGVTGYNVYRDVVPNPAAWSRIAANAVDMDSATAGIQYVDQYATGGTYYYKVSAANGGCDVEGPLNP